MDFNQINAQSNWGKESEKINQNFQKTDAELEKIKGASGAVRWFATLTEMKAAVANPRSGDFTWVGTPFPGIVHKYNADTGAWINTGQVPVIAEGDMSDYATKDQLDNLRRDVEDKADQEALDSLVRTVGGKVDDSEFESEIQRVEELIPAKTSDLTNDSGYITAADLGETGSGVGNEYNATHLHPLASGSYYTLASAIAVVERNRRALGLKVTFSSSDSKWEEYRYYGTSIEDAAWATLDLWEVSGQGGSGTVESVSVNGGEKKLPDGAGNVNIVIDEIEVDATLDPESTNPVENQALYGKFQEVEAGTLFGSDVEIDEDNNEVTVSLLNKSNTPITQFTIPAGGGGGGGETAGSKVVLTASLSQDVIKEGGEVELDYYYDHQYTTGDDAGISTGQKATIVITIQRGSVVAYTQTFQAVSSGSYGLDVSKYLALGTNDIFIRATAIDPTTGKSQSRQAYQSVRVLNIALSSSYNLTTHIAGYQASEVTTIPFTVSGTGSKVVTVYIDGKQFDTRTVTRSGSTNGSFTIPMISLSAGRHTVQMVAELEEANGLTIKSESIYLDILRRGGEEVARFIGAMISFPDGRIFGVSQHLAPSIEVGQYEAMSFDFVVYDSTSNPATMDIYRDGEKTQTITASRTIQTYSNRFTQEGQVSMKFVSGLVEYPFYIEVVPSSIDIEEVTVGLALRLTAAGRSNTEENPAEWVYGDFETVFSNFDWSSNGWTGDVLRLTNGAAIEVGFQPFAADPSGLGGTYEIELECSNVSDRDAIVLDCMSGGVGFQMTTQKALLRSVGGVEVSTLFAEMNIKIAFVIQNKENTRLMELFVNGIRCGVAQYANDDSFLQGLPANIRINSEYADIDLRAIRVYNRALSGDEILDNYIIDRTTGEEMILLFNNNDVETDDGSSIDIDKLRTMGKSVMRIVGNVILVNQTNDKKYEEMVDIFFYSAYGKEYDFVARNIGIRIQGTSSTSYPRKNYRFYLNRASKYQDCSLEVGGVNVPNLKYAFKPGARPIDIFCMKADFAESSGTHNTGVARLINDVWKKCGNPTPPQAGNRGQYDVRTTVDGFPCDIWLDNNRTNVNAYIGKYNFNNEKSASGIIYGFEGVEGFNDEATLTATGERNKCMCLEFLNNSEPLCLFTTDDMTRFDDALEFRFKEDTTWSTAHADDKAAIQRLWTWIYACRNNPTKFKTEAANYFDTLNLRLWYLFTEYFMAVDQRAKNMMLATWDGLIWWFLPYDSDTIFGVRNDGVLKYNYDIDENSFDDSIQSWCYAGHDSILWRLVRETLNAELASAAATLRSNMSTSEVLDMFNVKQMSNWSERVYNKDGEFKYIIPLTEGVQMPTGNQFYNYLYSLQGSRYAHRTFIIQNRFALLDAKYVVGTYRADSFTAYFGHQFSQDPRKLRITASEKYYFGYGYTSGQPTVSAVPAERAGDLVELTFNGDLIVNDPQNIYGASRMAELDLTNISAFLLQTLNLNNCTSLKNLDASCPAGNTTLNNILVANCRGLREINITGLRSAGFTSMDVSKNSRLEKFYAGGTALTGVSFALGAPLTEAILPASLLSLEMRSLNKLTLDGLIFQSAGNVTRLVAANCELLDWEELLDVCYGVRYLRVTGINKSGDATMLERFKTMGGIDENGSNTTTCRLVGDYQLTTYVEDDKLAEYRSHYPELNIRQSEYTVLEYDDSTSEPANVSNLDSKTGYKYGNDYVVSGHIKKILSLRHRVLGKKTAEGVVSYFPLHDNNSNKYADSQYEDSATIAVLTGMEGNVWVYEPRYWFKGINDVLNQKKYAVYSSNKEVSIPEGKKIEARDISFVASQAVRATSEYTTLANSLTADASYSYGIVNVVGYKKARFQGVSGALYGAVFLNAAGSIIKRVLASSELGMMHGMCVISDIPNDAVQLAFTVVTSDDKDLVWLTSSDNIADLEPDWVLHEECLGGAYNSSYEDLILRTKSGLNPTSVTLANARAAARNMGSGYRVFDYQAYRDVVNLAVAKYGTRAQNFGTATSIGVPTGTSNSSGMRDSVNLLNPAGSTMSADNTLGYESFIGAYTIRIEGLLINSTFRFTRRDGTTKTQRLPGSTTSGTYHYIQRVWHGREMDITPVQIGGSATTCYTDAFKHVGHSLDAVYYGGGRNRTPAAMGLFHFDNDNYNDNAQTRVLFIGTIKRVEALAEYKSLQKLD
jgi:hypothetical protein